MRISPHAAIVLVASALVGCAPRTDRFAMPEAPGPDKFREDAGRQDPLALPPRVGDAIVIAGQRFHTGAPVVLWSDPGGYNAYLPSPVTSDGGVFNSRYAGEARSSRQPDQRLIRPTPTDARPNERIKPFDVQQRIDQFVLHYDMCGFSARCFDILHNHRGLSVHFLLDVDGTIYQTLDVQERAWHATKANDRSVGIEIANIGAYPPDDAATLDQWYAHDSGGAYIRIPGIIERRHGPRGGVRHARDWPLRPARSAPVTGQVHGQTLVQYDFTDAQYDSLIKLTAALNRALPRIRLDYPREAGGGVLRRKLTDGEFARFSGVLGHWHVQENKIDPGPALDWERVINGARRR